MTGRRTSYRRAELRRALSLALLLALLSTLVATVGGAPTDLLAGLPIVGVVLALFNFRAPAVELIERVAASRRQARRVPARSPRPRLQSPARPLLQMLATTRALRGPPALA